MKQIYFRNAGALVLCWCATIGCIFLGCQPRSAVEPQKPSKRTQRLEVFQERTFTVEPGVQDDAFQYYKTIFDELGLNPNGLKGEALVASLNLTKLLEFLGYKDLKAEDTENLPSAELMKRFPDRILSSAFFAPKITDVSIAPINVGWRKLVRLKAQGDASKKGIASAFLLFNKFQGADKYNDDPFKSPPDNQTESKNTQLILTRDDGSKLKHPMYFLVFGPLSKKSKLITFLTASFDARAPNIVKDNKYFVPNACAECHGGLINADVLQPDYERLKLNYLDTDHWFDRLSDEFAFLNNYKFGVLYDGGKDESTAQFAAAFEVLRQLNREIKTQNERVEPSPAPTPEDPSFQLRAVTKWLQLHVTDSRHKDVLSRALPSSAGAPWADQSPDRELLPLMNQYCFRCHSSLRFNIFDRPEVVKRKSKILRFMNLPTSNKTSMPQDRNLDCSVKTLADKMKILKLVCDLDNKPCPTASPTPTPECPTPSPTP